MLRLRCETPRPPVVGESFLSWTEVYGIFNTFCFDVPSVDAAASKDSGCAACRAGAIDTRSDII